jgi:predicted DNA binding CopG/RHH family protein
MTKLNKEEKALLKSFENDEWQSDFSSDRFQKLQSYANFTINQNQEITINLSPFDLEKLEAKAIQEGISYQTLITSILHKYVTGKLVESV